MALDNKKNTLPADDNKYVHLLSQYFLFEIHNHQNQK